MEYWVERLFQVEHLQEKGFKEAEKAFGGELPEISHETFKRTMEKMDAWENE